MQVLHPALEGSPGHAHWKALCGAQGEVGAQARSEGRGEGQGEGAEDPGLAAGLFSVVFDGRYSAARVDAFCDALQLFKLGYSWGGPISLVVPYDVPSMRDASVSAWPHEGVLVRFSIGLEDVADLQADLAQALAAL